ncbi:MAG TPA: hypothetical protein VMV05_01385 [bacterium]|nr:hypothetical protein [bacterium]
MGNFESAILYPLNWAYLFLPLLTAINTGIVLHVFLAGLFTFLWAHYRGLHPLACFISGTVFMFGGTFYLHVFAGHLPNLCAMAWTPLFFLAIDGLSDKVSRHWILLGIFALSMQILAGHPQYVYFTLIIASFYLALNLIGSLRKWPKIGGFVLILTGALCLTAAQSWTGIEAAAECGRKASLDFRSASSFFFPPENLVTLVMPEFFGNMTSSPYWGRWFLWEVSAFMGIAAFFLMVLSVFGTDASKRKWALTMAILALVFSLGKTTPLYSFLYNYFPGFSEIRGICKFYFLTGLFLALLAGIGLDQWIQKKRLPIWLLWAVLSSGLLFFVFEIGIMNSLERGAQGWWNQWFSTIHWLKNSVQGMESSQRTNYIHDAGLHSAFSLWVGGMTCLLLSVILSFQKFTFIAIGLVAGCVVLELFLFARVNRPTFEWGELQKKYEQINSLYAKNPGDYRIYGTGAYSLVTGGYDLWEDEPMVLERYGRFVCASQGLEQDKLFSEVPIFKRFHPVFGMLRLKYRVFADRDPVQVYSMPFKLLPRMKLIDQWEVVPDSRQILPRLFDPTFDPGNKVYLESDPGLVPTSGKSEGNVEWKDLSTEEISIRVETPRDCVLLVTDNYSRGWNIKNLDPSDRAPLQVMPANSFLRAIPLKAGEHKFILRYRPVAFEVGKWVSLLSLLLYVVILAANFREHHALRKPSSL